MKFTLRLYSDSIVYQVSAFTRAGDGVASAPLYCVTEEDRPEVPAGIKAVASSATSIIVSWQPPLRSNGIITSYSVHVRAVGPDGPDGKWFTRNLPPHKTFYLAENLHKKNQYEFNIAAVTAVGDGPRTPSILVSPSSEGIYTYDFYELAFALSLCYMELGLLSARGLSGFL